MADSDYIERLRYNDGEGIEHNDFDKQETLIRRTLHTDVLGLMASEPWTVTALPLAAPVCRPIGTALLPVHVPATSTVRVGNGGLWFAPVADPGTPSEFALFHRLGAEVAGTFDVVNANPSGGGAGDRNDLLTAKVVEVNDVADDVARDFQDSVTGALSSQPATNKRFRTRLTLTLIEGVEGGGDPAVPADEVLIARYIMRDAAVAYLAADIEDLRTPTIWPRVNEVLDLTNPRMVIHQVEEFTPELFINGVEVSTYVARSGRVTRFATTDEQVLVVHVSIQWTGGTTNNGVEVRNFPFNVTKSGYNGPFGTHVTLGHSYPQVAGIIATMKDGTGADIAGTVTGTLNISFTAER